MVVQPLSAVGQNSRRKGDPTFLFNLISNSIVKLFNKDANLRSPARCFYEKDENLDIKKLVDSGTNIICKLYDDKSKDSNLNRLRYKLYIRRTTGSSFTLDNLPPTTAAAKQHCLRVYLQV
ncbi:hypothetical protein QAD02_020925 [Eretmocerus hayati]|uniref:Uncharacterized protein n=1 Tax=Eretmocerus hayati TaxID=131215 RepID=A0ACC2PP07_9HYME|nr:hypothetical protein QAD02_020925 [Eretmocerus hayati]